MGTWYTSFKFLGMIDLQYKMRICQKVIIKLQRQFMYGSNFYESDVRYFEAFSKLTRQIQSWDWNQYFRKLFGKKSKYIMKSQQYKYHCKVVSVLWKFYVRYFTVYVIQNHKGISPTCTKESWGPLQAKKKKIKLHPCFFLLQRGNKPPCNSYNLIHLILSPLKCK